MTNVPSIRQMLSYLDADANLKNRWLAYQREQLRMSRKRHREVWIASLLLIAATVCKGDTLYFAYDEPTTSIEVLTGTLLGTLQVDGNTFIVTSVESLALNGVPVPTLPTNLISFDTNQGLTVGTQYA